MKLILTDEHKNFVKRQIIKGKDVEIISRSGLHPTEYNLFKQDFKEDDLKETLFLNNRTGCLPMYLSQEFPDANISLLNIDYHYYRTVKDNLIRNRIKINNLCQSSFSTEKKLTSLFLQIDTTTFSKELFTHLFFEHYLMLKKKGKVYISCEKRALWFEDFLRHHEMSYTLEKYRSEYVIIMRKKQVDLPNLSYDDMVKLALPNRPEVNYKTTPGVFANHRIDEGALALIDTVEATEDDTLLDMGCGIGTVAVALGKYYNCKKILCVDSNVRALDCCKFNCDSNGLENCSFYLTDEGVENKDVSIFVGNPPYFSNYRIADLFIDNAYSNIKRGGRAYIVAKNINHIQRAMIKVFGNVRVVSRRGYNVVISTK